jgi:hypothetical protein
MLPVYIMLTPGRRNECIESQKVKVLITVLPIMDVKIRWNSALELYEEDYQLWEFTCEWLKNPTFSNYPPLFTIQDEWTVIKYVMEVVRSFQYWTVRMSTWHTVTLHYVITVYHNKFDHMDGVMRALATKKTQWKDDLYLAVNVAHQKISKYYTKVTLMTGWLYISAHILDPFRKLGSFRKWEKRMDTNPDDETSYHTVYQEAFPKYVGNKHCTKHWWMLVIKPEKFHHSNIFSSAKVSWFGQSSFNQYDFTSYDN